MGPPPPRVPAPGSSTVGSSTPASAPSSQPSSSCDPENGDPENHPSKRPKVGAKKSWVWDHFIENFTPGYAKCKYCPATYKA
ncbi:hypothetical protein MKW94_009141, partial [Papaver nudicaule]|nr:hypothetical protein [Papaver nudicaule]